MIRPFARSVFLWSIFAFVALSSFELLLFGRLEPTRSLPSVIGLAIADRTVPIGRP
ncbi:hypothetical protein [Natronococcus amylolyticus]|uniref:hypothetical protein n=1 Tax=Natronococcus amylolyticus TaxID=44470 RepID=UPI0014615597|nr:hypothetical protein [Natronococcus amylolyticus]